MNVDKFLFIQKNKRLDKIKVKPIKPNSPMNWIKSECAWLVKLFVKFGNLILKINFGLFWEILR